MASSSVLKCKLLLFALLFLIDCMMNTLSHDWTLLNFSKHHKQWALTSSSYTCSMLHSNPSLEQCERRTAILLYESLKTIWKAAALIMTSLCIIDTIQLQLSRQVLCFGAAAWSFFPLQNVYLCCPVEVNSHFWVGSQILSTHSGCLMRKQILIRFKRR